MKWNIHSSEDRDISTTLWTVLESYKWMERKRNVTSFIPEVKHLTVNFKRKQIPEVFCEWRIKPFQNNSGTTFIGYNEWEWECKRAAIQMYSKFMGQKMKSKINIFTTINKIIQTHKQYNFYNTKSFSLNTNETFMKGWIYVAYFSVGLLSSVCQCMLSSLKRWFSSTACKVLFYVALNTNNEKKIWMHTLKERPQRFCYSFKKLPKRKSKRVCS